MLHVLAIEPIVDEDPCEPNPCGENANARDVGDRCQCTCFPGMIGQPPNCRPECQVNADCPLDRACLTRKCLDPCPGLCGVNAQCNVNNHVPICVCSRGFFGDPFTQCRRSIEIIPQTKLSYLIKFLATTRAPEIIDPCNPSPCGINAECSARNGAASCSCFSSMEGDPYIACKHECTVNTECPSHLACINNKCRDPCPGVCGAHAYCRVTNHFPICKCDAGYIGDPFTSCQIKPTRKKKILVLCKLSQNAPSF